MPVQTLSQNQPVDVTLRPPKSSVQPHCDASLVEDQACVDTPSGDGHSSTAADSEVKTLMAPPLSRRGLHRINQDDIQPVELGSVSKLFDKPGCFLCYEGEKERQLIGTPIIVIF